MSNTDTNVVVTQYRAEFSGLPFAPYSGAWRIRGGMEYRTTLKRRRRWTVTLDYQRSINSRSTTMPASEAPVGNRGHVGIHRSNLLDPDATVVFVPDTTAGARHGTAILIEQVNR